MGQGLLSHAPLIGPLTYHWLFSLNLGYVPSQPCAGIYLIPKDSQSHEGPQYFPPHLSALTCPCSPGSSWRSAGHTPTSDLLALAVFFAMCSPRHLHRSLLKLFTQKSPSQWAFPDHRSFKKV